MIQITQNAVHVDMPHDEYHAHPAVGSSMLEDFRKSRRDFKARHIDKTAKPRVYTEEVELGTDVHMLLFEPGRFYSTTTTFPETNGGEPWNWRKPAHRKLRDEIMAELEESGKRILTPDRIARAKAMAKAITADKKTRHLLDQQGEAEYSIFWTDPATGIECKCRVDWWARISVDLKTTGCIEPGEYAKQCLRLGNYRKRAHYLAGIRALTGEKNPLFVHVAAENCEPFRVAKYNLIDETREGQSLGEMQRRTLLHELAECMESDQWEEPWEREVVDLHAPRYAFSEDEYRF